MKFRKRWSINIILAVSFSLSLVAVMPVLAGGQQESSDVQFYPEPTSFAGPDQVAIVGEPVEFLGQGASADAEIIEYAWDFDADGVPDFVSAQAAKTTYRFSAPGDYRCILTVRDFLGRTAQDSRRILVVAETADLQTAQEMLQPSLDAVSNPPDGVISRYAVMSIAVNETVT